MRTEIMAPPAWAETVTTPSVEPIFETRQLAPAPSDEPTGELTRTEREGYRRGSLIRIVALKRPFFERRRTGTKAVKPGRAPGRDLTGADLLGAVGTIVRMPETMPGHWPDYANPLILVRVDEEELYLNESEIVPFVANPSRD